MEWNEQQQKVLDKLDENVIVSASAGSGKTTVMIERIMKLLRRGTPVKRLVALSFNKSIARELKTKLYKEILKEISLNNSNYKFMCEQLDELQFANINTTEGYCMSLVKEYFYELGLDPNMQVQEEEAESLMLIKVITDVIDKGLDNGEKWLFSLQNKFQDKKTLINQVIKIYKFAIVQPNREEWLKNVASSLYSTELKDSRLIIYVLKLIKNRGLEVLNVFDRKILLIPQESPDSIKHIVQLNLLKESIAAYLKSDSYENVFNLNKSGCAFKKISISKKNEMWDNDYADLFYEMYDYIKWVRGIVKVEYEIANKAHINSKNDIEGLITLATLTMENFIKLKKEKGVLGFSDMSYYAIELLNNEKICSEVKGRYDYISIDEYQDTNYVHEYIFNKISNGNNLFMVGDSKQSIYKFRLAEPSILLNKFEDIENGKLDGQAIHLNYNYRSDENIVNFVNNVFNEIMTENYGGIDYLKNEKLIAGAEYKTQNKFPFVNINMYYTVKSEKQTNSADFSKVYSVKNDKYVTDSISAAYKEGEAIADKIMEMIGSGATIYDLKKKGERPITLNDFVILSKTRSNKVQEILKAIKDKGIPIDTTALSTTEINLDVEVLINALKIIDNDQQDIPLCGLLMSPLFGFDATELLKIREENPESVNFYRACLKSDKTRNFYNTINVWRDKSKSMSLAEILNVVVYEFGFSKFLLKEKDGANRLKSIMSFLKYLSVKNYDSINEFLRFYQSDDAEIDVDFNQIICVESVKTLTIHKSKGLEFPIVFFVDIGNEIEKTFIKTPKLIECDKEVGLSINYYDDENRIKVDNLTYEFMRELRKDEERAEAMRVFYVALTRAKNHLFLSGSCLNNKIKRCRDYSVNSVYDWLQNVAINNYRIMNLIKFNETEGQSEIKTVENFSYTPNLKPTEIAEIKKYLDFEYPFKNSTLTCIKYSVTEINQKQVYEDEIKLTNNVIDSENIFLPKSSAKSGTNYHVILENIDYNCATTEDIANDIKKMVEAEILTKEESLAINLQEILDILNSDIIKYAKQNKPFREKEFMLKAPACEIFDTDVFDDVLIQGAVDLIIDGEKLIVVDFKKSNKSTAELIRLYKKQLEIYALAVGEAMGRTVDRRVLYVIGSNRIIEL